MGTANLVLVLRLGYKIDNQRLHENSCLVRVIAQKAPFVSKSARFNTIKNSDFWSFDVPFSNNRCNWNTLRTGCLSIRWRDSLA